jgi:hypothetical protein
MIGLFWNIRGLGKIGRLPALANRIRESKRSSKPSKKRKRKDIIG